MFSITLPIPKKYSVLAPLGPTYWPTSICKKSDILEVFVAKIPSNLYYTHENIRSEFQPFFCSLNNQCYSTTILITPPKLFSSSSKN